MAVIPAHPRRAAPRRDAAALRILTKLYRDGDYQVVHTHSAKAGALGRMAAVRAGVPRIVHTLHGFPFHEFQPWWRRGAYVRIERRLGRHTDALLAVGGGVAAEAVRLGLALPERIRTIPPAVDPTGAVHGSAARGLARRRLGLPAGVLLVGTVGRVDYQKAPENWIDALLRDPKHHEALHREVRAVAEEIASDPRYADDESLGPDDAARDRFRAFARKQLTD